MFGLEVSYFAQAESLYDNILQDRETMINRRTVRRIQKRGAVNRCGFGINRHRPSLYDFVLLLVSHIAPPSVVISRPRQPAC